MWKNGSVYTGQFCNGMREGHGKWRSAQEEPCDWYEGGYANDRKNGFGKYVWADGASYEGGFKEDLKDGEGVVRYVSGKVAKMVWKAGQPVKKLFF